MVHARFPLSPFISERRRANHSVSLHFCWPDSVFRRCLSATRRRRNSPNGCLSAILLGSSVAMSRSPILHYYPGEPGHHDNDNNDTGCAAWTSLHSILTARVPSSAVIFTRASAKKWMTPQIHHRGVQKSVAQKS
jgi:hypothetical protein